MCCAYTVSNRTMTTNRSKGKSWFLRKSVGGKNQMTRHAQYVCAVAFFLLHSSSAFVVARSSPGPYLAPLRSVSSDKSSEAPPVNIGWDSHKAVSEVPDR